MTTTSFPDDSPGEDADILYLRTPEADPGAELGGRAVAGLVPGPAASPENDTTGGEPEASDHRG